jgi:hypothetical protein
LAELLETHEKMKVSNLSVEDKSEEQRLRLEAVEWELQAVNFESEEASQKGTSGDENAGSPPIE